MQARIVANDKAARRMALVQSASAALETGQKLGDLPGAPSALARFADTNPPTEAALRLAFPQAARQALAGHASGRRGQAAADAPVGSGAGSGHRPPG